MNEFAQLGVDNDLVKAVTDLGYEQPSAIQQQAIPVLGKGDTDFVGLAQTGTGKTAAFSLPLLGLIDDTKRHTQALVLAPTRELCVQIANDIVKFTKYKPNITTVAVYGGTSISNQIRDLRNGAQVIVATPGRLMDLMDRGAIKLNSIRYVVLDEADEMLNMGFKEDIETILSDTPNEKNTWLFSATMPKEVRTIASKFMTNPVEISVGKKNSGNENIEHIAYVVHARDRYPALKRVVDFHPDIFGIVFCRTKIETQDVAEHLMRDGYNADSLHGDLSQQQRDKVMGRFRDRSLQILVATDVAARGIDVSDITHVINYNIPDDIESYTHRSGRTARAGKTGISIIIANIRDMGRLRDIERMIGKAVTVGKLPNGFEVCERQLFTLMSRIHDVAVNEKEIEQFLPKIYEQMADLSKEELVKRFASIEFNRFLDYYKNAPDLNVEGGRRGDRDSRGADRSSRGGERSSDRGSERGERSQGGARGGSYSKDGAARMFINVGRKDGMLPGDLVRMVAENANIPGRAIGQITLRDTFSFFEVETQFSGNVLDKLKGVDYNGRAVRVDLSDSNGAGNSGGGERSSGGERSNSGGYGGAPRSGGERSRSPRRDDNRSSGGGGERKRSYGASSREGGRDSRGSGRPSGPSAPRGGNDPFAL